MKKNVLLFIIFFSVKAFAQEDIAAKYGNTITGVDLKKHLTIFASN
jgi:hypothetical protein